MKLSDVVGWLPLRRQVSNEEKITIKFHQKDIRTEAMIAMSWCCLCGPPWQYIAIHHLGFARSPIWRSSISDEQMQLVPVLPSTASLINQVSTLGLVPATVHSYSRDDDWRCQLLLN